MDPTQPIQPQPPIPRQPAPSNPTEPPVESVPSLPTTQPVGSETPVVKGIDEHTASPPQNPPVPKDDEIFIFRPEAAKKADKKSVALTIFLTFIGIVVLIGVFVFALVGSATGLANDYRNLALKQMNKLDVSLKDLEPSLVLDRRNLTTPLQTISISSQSQPSLENVLFIAELSPRYKTTEDVQSKVHVHYKDINAYAHEIQTLIKFDDTLQVIFDDEPHLASTVVPNNSLSIRSVSGSYESFTETITKAAAPPQIKQVKEELVNIYKTQAAIYLNWAVAVEAGDAGGAAKAKQELAGNSAKIVPLVEDQYYSNLFQPSYNTLLKAHKNLKVTLAS